MIGIDDIVRFDLTGIGYEEFLTPAEKCVRGRPPEEN